VLVLRETTNNCLKRKRKQTSGQFYVDDVYKNKTKHVLDNCQPLTSADDL